MFRISRRLDYGLQLMIALASQPENRPQSTAVLAEKLYIPLPFLHQIGHMLMQAGLIKASPGPHGGIRLNRSSESITLLQIVEILEGSVSLDPCQENNGDCPPEENSITQSTWDVLQDKLTDHLRNITLGSMEVSAQSILDYSKWATRQASGILSHAA
jgi:Rrf2 family protein